MWILRLFPVLVLLLATPAGADSVRRWMQDWPRTDFARSAVSLDDIRPGGPDRDGIPSIDAPRFAPASEAGIPDVEPVLSLSIGEDAKAYPLRILIWHQIVNDVVGGVPVVVTYCPLCNAAIAFDRRVGGETREFGSTGLLRYSDMVMYDRQTESWWQQYDGRAIVGQATGARLLQLPSRLEAMGRFRARFPHGWVQVPADPGSRPYGRNPYTGYDSMPSSYYSDGPEPEGVAPLARVVAVGGRAWTLDLVRARGRMEVDGLVIEWMPGQASALDAKHIAEGRDVGNVVVRERRGTGYADVPYTVEFAFVFKAFHPNTEIVFE